MATLGGTATRHTTAHPRARRGRARPQRPAGMVAKPSNMTDRELVQEVGRLFALARGRHWTGSEITDAILEADQPAELRTGTPTHRNWMLWNPIWRRRT